MVPDSRSWPPELKGFVEYLKTASARSGEEVCLNEVKSEIPTLFEAAPAIEKRLFAIEAEVSALREDLSRNLEEVANCHKISTGATDAVSSIRALLPLSLPRDIKDLKESTSRLDTEIANAHDLLGRVESRLESEVSRAVDEKLEELHKQVLELRSQQAAAAAGPLPRQMRRQDSLAQVSDQCSQLSTRMGKLEEMVSGQGRQLLIQAEDQRNVQQRLLEVRREALEGLTQLAQAQEPPMQRAESEMQIGQPMGTARTSSGRSSQQLASESRGSVVRPYASMPLTQSSRKSTSQQLHPSKLKWPSGGVR